MNGRLLWKAYRDGTSLGVRWRDVLTWGGKMKRQWVEVEDGSGARKSQLVGARVVPVQLEVGKLGVLGKHLCGGLRYLDHLIEHARLAKCDPVPIAKLSQLPLNWHMRSRATCSSYTGCN